MTTDDGATQETPAGATIPTPKRKDVFGDLRKVAKARLRDDDSDASAGSAEDEQGE